MRGEGRIFQRGRMWWIAYYGPGDGGTKEIRESSGAESLSAARKLLRERLREVANHRTGVRAFTGPSAEKISVNDLIDSLESDRRRRGVKSLRRTIGLGKLIRDFFGHRRAISLTADLVRQYIELRKAKGISNAKVNRETEILSAAYGLALKEERIPRRPHIPHLPENNARRGFFEADEHQRVLQHLATPVDDVARFAYVSGWREGEILPLRWENVDRAAKEVRLFDSKNGEGRVLPLDDATWALFERLWAARQFQTSTGPKLSEFVFHCRGRALSESKFRRIWAAARKAADLSGKLFHDYRRTAVRNMIRAGVPQTVAMAITGHKTDSMFRRYNITTADDKRDALRRQIEYLKLQTPATNVAEFKKAGDADRTRTNA
jgi:integrase